MNGGTYITTDVKSMSNIGTQIDYNYDRTSANLAGPAGLHVAKNDDSNKWRAGVFIGSSAAVMHSEDSVDIPMSFNNGFSVQLWVFRYRSNANETLISQSKDDATGLNDFQLSYLAANDEIKFGFNDGAHASLTGQATDIGTW